MKLKKVLLTTLLALVAIMLLQLQVNAGNVSEYIDSEYDHFLTASNKMLSKAELSDEANAEETVIASIKGEYTGTIGTRNHPFYGDIVTLNNFNADVVHFEEYQRFDIEGRNSINKLTAAGNDDGRTYFIAMGDGMLTYSASDCWGLESTWAESLPIHVMDYERFIVTLYLGNYISEIKNAEDRHLRYIYNVFDTNDLEEYLLLDVDMVRLYIDNGNTVPSTVFNELAKHPRTRLEISNGRGEHVEFRGDKITNFNASFTAGCKVSNESAWDMVDTKLEDVVYINFENSGPVPGTIFIDLNNETFKDDDILKCYYYDETTKLYVLMQDAEMLGIQLKLNIDHGGKYVVSKTELPAELVAESSGGIGSAPDGLWHEVGVDSLEWTEEDIDLVLEAIEETKKDTINKYLVVQVPSGSKVPAKIFEAAKGIDISIKSEDGIWATFLGGNYKAIDYVAGGTVSNKVINGMVNVGESNIVYLSLKHDGELPAKCEISYHGGTTMDGMGEALENLVEAKLYLYNEEAKKYELCGSGEMDLVVDYYCFTIDHCSSYVMSEEELPAEFVIASTTGEENKKEEPKKEENKKEDTTKAPGKIPYAGGTTVVVISMLAVVAIGIIAYKKNKDLRGI